MLKHADSLKLPKEKIDKIFVNLPELLTIHEDVTAAFRKVKGEKDPMVADIFSKFVRYYVLLMY